MGKYRWKGGMENVIDFSSNTSGVFLSFVLVSFVSVFFLSFLLLCGCAFPLCFFLFSPLQGSFVVPSVPYMKVG